mmetsp:Transcript_12838/g.27454  ORF Transcript_12838/g.27454 Transcript_12838/m.27454 type:complete len:460 (-) Transcript_12838:6-1385(-)
MQLFSAGIIFGAAAGVFACKEDLVTHLPGWDRELTSKMYAGYVGPVEKVDSPGTQLNFHYVLFESENDPTNDPVLVYTSGGPGSPSIYGALYELGPYKLDELSWPPPVNGTGIPVLLRNDYAWNRKANLLIMTSSPPVGYSYCNHGSRHCGAWNDTSTAIANLGFLKGFYEKFPRFKTNKMFLAGDSYGGIYVPLLAKAILKDNSDLKTRFSGIAVGNGALGTALQANYEHARVEFFYGHGQVSLHLYKKYQKAKCRFLNPGETASPECQRRMKHIFKKVTSSGKETYGLYDECQWGEGTALSGYQNFPCRGPAGNIWVHDPTVQEALHVKKGVSFTNSSQRYRKTCKDVTPLYKKLFLKQKKFRVLIYVGDTDAVLGINLQQWWMSTLPITSKERNHFRAWTLDGKRQEVGYVTYYKQNITFVTIRGAVHTVPESKPREAALMIESFMSNSKLPKYNN